MCSLFLDARFLISGPPVQGREFYCCPKPRESQCGFFKWTDEEESGEAAQFIRGEGEVREV
jgi:hypothetical protein